MTEKFDGTFSELTRRVAATGIGGSWSRETGAHTYRATTGAILKWCPKTGSLSFQGPFGKRTAFRNLVLIALNWPAQPILPPVEDPTLPIAVKRKRKFLILRAEILDVEEEQIDGKDH